MIIPGLHLLAENARAVCDGLAIIVPATHWLLAYMYV